MLHPLPDDWRDCLEEPDVRDAQEDVLGTLHWDFARDIEAEGPSRLGVIVRGASPSCVLPVLHLRERKEAAGKMRIALNAYLRSPTFPVEHWTVLFGPEVSKHVLGRISTRSRAALLRLAFAHRKDMLEREFTVCIAGRSPLSLIECQRRLDGIDEHYRNVVLAILAEATD